MNNIQQISPVISQNADVVFVGGGPVGLWTAIQTRVLTQKNIVVLERHQEYQRADIRLNLDPSSFSGTPKDPGLDALITNWKSRKIVPIKEMEEGLVARANELGISILKGHTVIPDDLPTLFPYAKVFVGSDGARSKVREKVFGDSMRFNTTLQHIVQVQYIAKTTDEVNEKNPYKQFTETYVTQKFAKHLIFQTNKPQEDGTTRITLQIFVTSDIYEKMSDATFRNPYYFESDLNKIPEPLADALKKWWGAREAYHNEVILPSGKSNKITVIALGSYAAKDFVKEKDGRIWALVGDAAAAFPFFRAINNGLLTGTDLASRISQAFKKNIETPNEPLPIKPFKSYSFYAKRRAYTERIVAFCKNLFISISNAWIKFTKKMPWLPVKLSRVEKERLKTLGETTWTRLAS